MESRCPESGYAELLNAHENRKIKRACFSAGGSLMLIYAGVYHAGHEMGLWSKLEDVAGNSAGSVSAAMVAIGIEPGDLYRSFRETDFSQLLGERVGTFGSNPLGITPITKDGKFMLSLLRSVIIGSIKKFLDTEINETSPEFLSLLRQRVESTEPVFTFDDLAQLKSLFPHRFKNLFCEAVTWPDGKKQIFSSKTTPHVDIALACCASSAVPGAVLPVEINEKKYMDGGIYNFIPLNCFDFPNKKNRKKENTLAFIFVDDIMHENSTSFKALHGNPDEKTLYQPFESQSFLRENMIRYFTGLKTKYTHAYAWNRNYRDLARHYPLNTVVLSTCGVSSLNLSDSNDCARQLYASGYLDLLKYMVHHGLGGSECSFTFFYEELIDTFNVIYTAIAKGANLSQKSDPFWIKWHEAQASSEKVKVDLLLDYMQNNLTSITAIALPYALEFVMGLITAEELWKDVYLAAFANSTLISPSHLTGTAIYKTQSLKEALKTFSLFHSLPDEKGKRTQAVLASLNQLPAFVKKFQMEKELALGNTQNMELRDFN